MGILFNPTESANPDASKSNSEMPEMVKNSDKLEYEKSELSNLDPENPSTTECPILKPYRGIDNTNSEVQTINIIALPPEIFKVSTSHERGCSEYGPQLLGILPGNLLNVYYLVVVV